MSELVSVIMGIYNCADTLPEALDSILHQSYQNWELILCDDGSSDHTAAVAQSYADQYPNQIYLLKNEHNLGLNATLNRCLATAKGSYIARMDGDDRCAPDRFAKEVTFLDTHPEIAIVSTDMEFFDADGVWGQTHVSEKPDCINFVYSTPFCHAACMARREAYLAVGGYTVDKKLLRVEDYYLWTRMYEEGFRGVNIQEPLYSMRDDRNAQARRKFKYRINEAYVKAYAIKHLHLPSCYYLYCAKPILIGLLPSQLYKYLHRRVQSGE